MAAADETLDAAEASPQAWPSRRTAWFVVVILSLTLFVNFLDRGIINLLARDIKVDLHLSDSQWALIVGFAFALFYAFIGLPIARLVDLGSRKTIITIGVLFWSVMTAATGLARSFGQLFLVRMGVGIGEACTGPATFSMLADYFPRDKLARALAVLQGGYIIGSGLASIAGGALILAVATMPAWNLPFIGDPRPWQRVLMLVGALGLIVAVLMLLVPEPARQGAKGKSIPIREVLAYLAEHRAAYGPMLFGAALKTVMSFGAAVFIPLFYMRTYHWSPATVAFVGGAIGLTAAPLGNFTGAYLAERWAKQGHADANMRVVVWSSLILTPISVIFPLMPSAGGAVAMAVVSSYVASWVLGPQNAALQVITPNRMRGQVSAIWLFIFNVIGFGLGPNLTAFFTDHVYHSEAHVGWSLATVAAIIGPIATFILWRSLKGYGASLLATQ